MAPAPTDKLSASLAVPLSSVAYVKKGTTLSQVLRNDLGLSKQDAFRLLTSIKPLANPTRIPANTEVVAHWTHWVSLIPDTLEIKLADTKALVATRDINKEWHTVAIEHQIDRQTVAYSGAVVTNLWSSARAAGMEQSLIHKLAEVFAWQVDFNREVQEGDRWRLTVEKLTVATRPVGYGDILAAEYENAGRVYTAVRHVNEHGRSQYFAPDGSSMQRLFLRSPLKFGQITSGFSARRFHPILHVTKPHLGVDYGAPEGTPVLAVGDGTVTEAGMRGGSGNMVTLRHNSAYQTAYKHLKTFAAGIRPGSRVNMGQVIGYVGSTGLATGPHLHFEFYESGRVVDPQGIRFPAADPVPSDKLKDFRLLAASQVSQLPSWAGIVLSQDRREVPSDETTIPNE